MRKKLLRCFLVWIICMLMVPDVVDAGTIENMLPEKSPINDNGSVSNELYELFDVDNYKFDGDFGTLELFDRAINSVLGGLYVAKTFGLKIALYIFQWGIYFPIFNDLAGWIGDAVQWMGGDLFKAFLNTISVFISTWMLIELFRRRYADSFKSLGISVVFLALSMVLFNNMGGVLKFVNDFSNSASAEIMAITQEDKSEKELNKAIMVQAGNKIWENYVMIPWQFGEFGKSMKPGSEISKDSKDPIAKDTYLILNATDDERENLVSAWAKSDKYATMSDEGITGRGVIVIVGSVTDFIFAVFLITLSLFQIFYKLAFLILAFMAPVVCLFAAWPRNGVWTVIHWAKNWLGAGLYGIVVALLLSFYLGISTKLYQLVPKMGWFFGGVVPQLVLIIMLVLFRKQVIQLFTMPVRQTKKMYNASRRYIRRGEPLTSGKRQFGGAVNKAFDNVENKLREQWQRLQTQPATTATTTVGGSGFSKPYLQRLTNGQQFNANRKTSGSTATQTVHPEIIDPKSIKGTAKKPDVIDAEFDEVEGKEPMSLPDQPTRGRLVNGQFISLPAPASTPKSQVQQPKPYKLTHLTNEQKKQLKLATARIATKIIMEKVKR